MVRIPIPALFLFAVLSLHPCTAFGSPEEEALRKEVRPLGWIVYSARADNGSWDLFLSRPDGSEKRNLTDSPDYEEAAPRFSPDGKRFLFRRLAKGTVIDHDQWGFQGTLAIARADGSGVEILGEEGEHPWADWSPDGTQISTLTKKGIQIVDLETREMVRQIPRKGIYQQLFWSPDGKWFCGVANHGGEYWTVVRMNAESGDMAPLRSFQTCTPDWRHTADKVILSTRPAGQTGANGYGYTQLWEVSGDGADQRLLFGEDGVHIYSGAYSPDAKYILFSKCPEDGGGSEKSGGTICLMRIEDAPTIAGPSEELRKLHPNAKSGTVIEIDQGWEPHWTFTEVLQNP